LEPVFRWKHYWQVKCAEIKDDPGKKSKIRLSASRDVEIDMTNEKKRQIHLFRAGQRVRTFRAPTGKDMTIQGGISEKDNAWFIVVRRDKPAE
jgi:hypothetical protein